MFQTWLGLPHPSIVGIPQCVRTHPIDVIGVHFLCCTHDNELIGTHDEVCDTFVTFAWDVWNPCGTRTITHTSFNNVPLLSSMSWHCVHQRWNSHPSWCCHCWSNTNGFTLPILCNLKICCLQSNSSQRKGYCDRHPIDHFLLLTIEVFQCLDKQVFLHDCANAMWNFKRLEGLPFSVLVTFLCQKISITLQRMQTSSILSRVIAIGLATSWLPHLQNAPPIPWLTSYKESIVETKRFWHLVCVCFTSCKLILFIFLCPLYIF